jgi:hypothetical protein
MIDLPDRSCWHAGRDGDARRTSHGCGRRVTGSDFLADGVPILRVAAWAARVARAAAYPGERAACAKSHDLTAGLQSISLSLVATLRKLHPADSIADFPKVAFGSKGEVPAPLCHVRHDPAENGRDPAISPRARDPCPCGGMVVEGCVAGAGAPNAAHGAGLPELATR